MDTTKQLSKYDLIAIQSDVQNAAFVALIDRMKDGDYYTLDDLQAYALHDIVQNISNDVFNEISQRIFP